MNSAASLSGPVSELGKTFAGQLLQRADPGYDDARKVHNGLIDKAAGIDRKLSMRAQQVAAIPRAVSYSADPLTKAVANASDLGRPSSNPSAPMRDPVRAAASTARRRTIATLLPASAIGDRRASH